MRRSFAYSVVQPNEDRVRADVARIVEGFPVKSVELQPWDMGGFRVHVHLDLPEEVEHVRRDVEALARQFPGGEAVRVKDTLSFADISWEPFTRRDICLGEYVEVIGPKGMAVIWQLFDECRVYMGPLNYDPRGPWALGSDAELSPAVARVLNFVVNGVLPDDWQGRDERSPTHAP